MLLPLNLLYLTLSLLPSTLAVFADDAYHVDYHHELLGLPLPHTTFFHRPQKDEKATLLYTLSDLGVLGAVHPGTGKVVWRQLLSNGTEGFLRPVEGEGTVVSARGNKVSAWDAMSGLARWEAEFAGTVKDVEILEQADGKDRDVLVLFEDTDGKGVVRRLNGESGAVVWTLKDTNADTAVQVTHNIEDVFQVALWGANGAYNVRVTAINPETGRKRNEYTLPAKADISGPQDILFVGPNPGMPFIAWTDKAKKNLKINILAKSGSLQNTLPLKEVDRKITQVDVHAPTLKQSLNHFLVHTHSENSNRADVYHVDLIHGDVNHAYELPKLPGKGAISLSTQAANIYFTRVTEDEVIVVSSASHGILGRWPIKTDKKHGTFLHGASEVVQRSADSYAVRTSIITSEEDWVMVRNGDEAWTRVEGLSGAVAAQWAEIPEEESLAKTLEAEAHSNPLSAYIHRVNRHIGDLQYLPDYLAKLPQRLLTSIVSSDSTTRTPGVLTIDNFGFNKVVLVATQRGRIYGLDSGNQGAVAWNTKAFDLLPGQKWDVKGIWAEPSKDIATFRGSDGEYIIIKPTTGKIVEKVDFKSWPSVESTAVIDSEAGTWLLPIGVDGNPGELPTKWAPKELVVVQGKDGEVRGLKFGAIGANATPLVAWSFHPGPGQKTTHVASRPAHDPVASIGRVLGDRNVLYKYLNLNTVLVTAVSDEAATASFYLLDTISGEVLYSTSHGGVDTKQPITSTLTENWFAYSLWSDILPSTTATLPSSKGYQLVVSELYESEVPNDRGPLGATSNSSSVEPSDIPNAEPALPHVISQSFIIPEPISHMSVSQTRQGITTRELLCTLAESNAIVGIPRNILDARRPVGRDPTPQEAEEGLFRYHPVIEFDPKIILTHKREVIGIKDVIATPALLESTSLVFAYGIDIFGTRVSPSAAFDILGKGFNKLSLVVTVVALGAGVAILAPMVRSTFYISEMNANYVTGKKEANRWEMDHFIDLVECTNRNVILYLKAMVDRGVQQRFSPSWYRHPFIFA